MDLLSHISVFFLSADARPEPGTFEWIVQSNVINIVLAALILGFLIKKFKLLSIFETQQEKIRKDVETIEKQKKAALKELNALKKRTKNLSSEVEEILNDAKTSADTLSKQIVADAKVEASKIVDSSKKRIELEQRSAAKDLERRLLADALDDAQQELSALAEKDKKRSVESFIDELAGMKS